MRFGDLHGWLADDHQTALNVFCQTCVDLPFPGSKYLCQSAENSRDARRFFEDSFDPLCVNNGKPALFTGYFEPEFPGAVQRTQHYRYPIHALPDDFSPDRPYLTRRAIDQMPRVAPVLAWLADPLDLFFLQVQGSGRIALTNGNCLRVGYAGKNGHPYTSIGQCLVTRGAIHAEDISPATIRRWARDNPDDLQALLWQNESYVFFRDISGIAPDKGPPGTMGHGVTARRSLAVDPDVIPLGLPVWIDVQGNAPMQRLMIAQDTGSAIKGAARADIFCGTGEKAGDIAGQIKNMGHMTVLYPKTLSEKR